MTIDTLFHYSGPSTLVRVPLTSGCFRQLKTGDDRIKKAPKSFLQIRKRSRLKCRRIPAQEAAPEAALINNLCECPGKSHRHFSRGHSLATPKSSPNCLNQTGQVELESSGHNPDVIKIPDPSVRLPKTDHRFELLGNDGFMRVHQDFGLRQI